MQLTHTNLNDANLDSVRGMSNMSSDFPLFFRVPYICLPFTEIIKSLIYLLI